jgi:hypothetical protein
MPTPNMGLNNPTPSVTTGPTWASMLVAVNELIDAHDHSSGKGVRVTPAGLNISSALSFGGNDATSLRSSRYSPVGGLLSLAADVGCTYVFGNDLYYRDVSGTNVQLTNGGTLNASALNSNVFPQRDVAIDTTVLAADPETHFSVDASVGNRVMTLPTAASVGVGRYYIFSDRLGYCDPVTPRTITIVRAGSDAIDGATSVVLRTPYAVVMIVRTSSTTWKAYHGAALDRLNGATVPAAGALTTGNVLRVTGTATLGYGAVDLANANAVTGILPAANLSLDGASSPLAFLKSASASIGLQALTSSGGGNQLSVVGQAGHTSGNGGTIAIQGGAAAGNLTGGTAQMIAGAGAGTGAGGTAIFNGGAGGATNGTGGISSLGGGAGGGVNGSGGAAMVIGGSASGTGAGGESSMLAGAGGLSGTGGDATVRSGSGLTLGVTRIEGATATATNANGGEVVLDGGLPNGTGVYGTITLRSSLTILSAAQLPGPRHVLALCGSANTTVMPANTGDKVIFIANASTTPTASAVGGGILYVSAGALRYRGSSGSDNQIAPA